VRENRFDNGEQTVNGTAVEVQDDGEIWESWQPDVAEIL
jgi:hypothetical protein